MRRAVMVTAAWSRLDRRRFLAGTTVLTLALIMVTTTAVALTPAPPDPLFLLVLVPAYLVLLLAGLCGGIDALMRAPKSATGRTPHAPQLVHRHAAHRAPDGRTEQQAGALGVR